MTDIDLKKISIFEKLDEDEINKLKEKFVLKKIPKDNLIFSEGEAGDSLLLVIKGEILITKLAKATHTEEFLATIREGEMLGEMSLFIDTPRTATAVARTDVELIEIKKDDILDFLQTQPQASLKIYPAITSTLINRLNKTSTELTVMSDLAKILLLSDTQINIAKRVLSAIKSVIEKSDLILLFSKDEFSDEFNLISSYPQTFESFSINASDNLVKDILAYDGLKEYSSLEKIPETSITQLENAKTIIGVGLKKEEKIYGLLIITNFSQEFAFEISDFDLIEGIYPVITQALESIKLREEAIAKERFLQSKYRY